MDIVVRGAREHTLKGIDLTIEAGTLVAFCGRSGSGKTSMALDTLHAEGRRRYLDALAFGRRSAVGALPRPAVDGILGLPPTVAIEQIAPPPARTATVATATDLLAVLQVLWGRAGTLRDPVSGAPVVVTPIDAIVAEVLSWPEGTRLHIEAPLPSAEDGAGVLREVVRAGFGRVRVGGAVVAVEAVRPADLDGEARLVVDRLKVRPDRADRLYDALRTASRAGQGRVVVVADDTPHPFAAHPVGEDGRALPERSPALFRTPGAHACGRCGGRPAPEDPPCPACGGTGWGPVARAVTFAGHTLPEVLARPVSWLAHGLEDGPRDAVTEPLLDELARRVDALVRLDLGALPLDRDATALSSGEWQRVRLASHLGADLSGVLAVVDEPEAGLDEARVAQVGAVLQALVAQGNTVIVIAHHPVLLSMADRAVEFGPGPGPAGGSIVYDGPPSGLAKADTPTGRAWRGEIGLDRPARDGSGDLAVPGWQAAVRRGGLTAVVGVSGAGKSGLLAAVSALAGEAGSADLERLVTGDGQAARGSRRSMPATYVGLWDVVRDLLAATAEAKVRGLEARAFSLNVAGGRCETCLGLGSRRVSLDVVADVDVPCETCEGRRFAADVLSVTWKGRHAAQLLDLRADEALVLLAGHPKLEEGLRALVEVGLGYVPLGQPVDTLSGGEQRRLRLARALVRAVRRGADDTLVVLDDPTAGLHPADVPTIVDLLDAFTARGATVVVATHHAPLAAVADRVIAVAEGAVVSVSDRTT